MGTDVAVLGDPESERALLMVSGTHGPEGLTGSACQQFFLDRFLEQFMDCRVVLVHMINAYGSSSGLRCTEEAVDLNRNFVDSESSINAASANIDYRPVNTILEAELKALLQGRSLDEAVVSAKTSIISNGLMSTAFQGQYAFGSGLGFGGVGPTAARRRVDSIIANELNGVTRIVALDIHTGLGEYGKALLLSMTEDDAEAQRLEDMLPKSVTYVNRPGSTLPYRVRGDLLSYMGRSSHAAEVRSLLVEYGTYDADRLLSAVLTEFFIRQSAGSLAQAQVDKGLDEISAFFYPADLRWQESVLNELVPVLNAALRELSVD